MATGRRCLSIDRLRETLHFDPDTGLWTWINPTSNRIRAGSLAGVKRKDGYILIGIDGTKYLAHRLAWLWMTGEDAPEVIDHVDRDPSNCKWSNLRKASWTGNAGNSRRPNHNKSGIKGVSWRKDVNKWVAMIRRNRRQFNLGLFDTKEKAAAAYRAAAQEHFGSFACFN